MGNIVKLRKTDRPGGYIMAFYIPGEVGTQVESMAGHLFTCELTEEGILFRPFMEPPKHEGKPPPSWVRKER